MSADAAQELASSSEADLIKRIKTCIAKGDHAKEKANQFYTSAGQYLNDLKKMHDGRGGKWAEWEVLVKEKCGIGKSRASELMQIADKRTTVEEVRASKNETSKIAHQKRRQTSPLISGETPARAGGTTLPATIEYEDEPEPTRLPPPENAREARERAYADAVAAMMPGLLQGAWKKVSAEMKRQFVADNADELRILLSELTNDVEYSADRRKAEAAAEETAPAREVDPRQIDLEELIAATPVTEVTTAAGHTTAVPISTGVIEMPIDPDTGIPEFLKRPKPNTKPHQQRIKQETSRNSDDRQATSGAGR
jgi:hypothetical protein